MIGLLVWILAIYFNVLMDSEVYGAFDAKIKAWYEENPESSFRFAVWEWFNPDSWDNKYQVASILKKYLPESIALWLAKDVLVVFLDHWHFSKACMMVCFNYYVALGTHVDFNQSLVTIDFPVTNISLFWYNVLLFLVGGQLFNVGYYTTRKL